jgi:phytoene dehydrogenase-like protein
VDALVRGLKKHGGRLALNTHVDSIVVEEGRAVGVKLRDGRVRCHLAAPISCI